MSENKYKIKISKLPKSEVEIEGEIEARLLALARVEAILNFNENLDIAGFRRGKIPEKVIIEKVGEKELLEKSAEVVLNRVIPQILKETKLDTLGRPAVSIQKLAFGNPLVFKLKIAVMPEFKLPEYKKLASRVEISENNNDAQAEKMSEKEVEKKLREVDKRRVAILEALLEETAIDLPEILVEIEIEKSLAQIKDDVARLNNKWEDYLAHFKKSEADLRIDLRANSEKKAKLQLILNKIAEVEKLEPDKEILENEIKKISELHPEANKVNVGIYVATQLLNQEVLKLLEK